jgi:hypothetical protein
MKRYIVITGLAALFSMSPLVGLARAQSAVPTKQAAYQEAVADLTDAFRSRRYVPRHEQVSHASAVRSRVILQDGEQFAPEFEGEGMPSPAMQAGPVYDPGYQGGEVIIPGPAPPHEVIGGCGEAGCGGGCATGTCSTGSCDSSPSCGGCGSCGQCCIPCPRIYWDRFSFFAGVHGFKSPMQQNFVGQPNAAPQASFGFHEGLNYSTPLPCFPWFQGQIGFQAYQSNLDSSPNYTATAGSSRKTYFLTAGIFRRIVMGDCGLQGGLVVDYMQDEWVYDIEMLQLRGEVGWVFSGGNEFGFWFAQHLNNAEDETPIFFPTAQAQSMDLYSFYYRRRALMQGGEGRMFLGWSGDSDVYLGADFALPLNDCFAIETGFAYLIPDTTPNAVTGLTPQDDGWNIQINLVFYPSGKAKLFNNYDRPLMPVANPGNFIPDLVP